MGELNRFFRSYTTGLAHYCPGCNHIHLIQTSGSPAWNFNGDPDHPTFSPSIKITYEGKDANGEDRPPSCCHYFLENGILKYCGDSTHALSGKEIPLPELPDWLADPKKFHMD